jgi:hypothetical protein
MSGLEKHPTAHLSKVGKSLEGYNKNQGVPTSGRLPQKIRL